MRDVENLPPAARLPEKSFEASSAVTRHLFSLPTIVFLHRNTNEKEMWDEKGLRIGKPVLMVTEVIQ